MQRSIIYTPITAIVRWGMLLCLLGVAVYCWPVDHIVVRRASGGTPLFSTSVPLGTGPCTGYVHSLERTPVWDYYRVVNSALWTWREYLRSHNAGLPFQKPEHGRFMVVPPWMVVQGGRMALHELYVRVGDAQYGRNVMLWPEKNPPVLVPLYKHIPREKICITVQRMALFRVL